MNKLLVAFSMLQHRDVNKVQFMKIDNIYHLVIKNAICYLVLF